MKEDDFHFSFEEKLKQSGLMVLGWSHLQGEDKTLALISNVGGSHWNAFRVSSQYQDGKPNPMNRWTQSVIDPVAKEINAEARYPFGSKIWPFQRWALAAIPMHSSPLGLLIHEQYGLWVAFRAALVFHGSIDLPILSSSAHPCENCEDKPCLSTCPVNAFSAAGLAVSACRKHLKSDAECNNVGCLARLACPVGLKYAYEPPQQAFHMRHFRDAL